MVDAKDLIPVPYKATSLLPFRPIGLRHIFGALLLTEVFHPFEALRAKFPSLGCHATLADSLLDRRNESDVLSVGFKPKSFPSSFPSLYRLVSVAKSLASPGL